MWLLMIAELCFSSVWCTQQCLSTKQRLCYTSWVDILSNKQSDVPWSFFPLMNKIIVKYIDKYKNIHTNKYFLFIGEKQNIVKTACSWQETDARRIFMTTYWWGRVAPGAFLAVQGCGMLNFQMNLNHWILSNDKHFGTELQKVNIYYNIYNDQIVWNILNWNV